MLIHKSVAAILCVAFLATTASLATARYAKALNSQEFLELEQKLQENHETSN